MTTMGRVSYSALGLDSDKEGIAVRIPSDVDPTKP